MVGPTPGQQLWAWAAALAAGLAGGDAGDEGLLAHGGGGVEVRRMGRGEGLDVHQALVSVPVVFDCLCAGVPAGSRAA